MGCVHRHRAVPQGQPWYRAHLARGRGEWAVRQLTAGPGSDRQPRWSPDGRTLAFVSTRENGAQLWVLPIAGGEARRVTSLADGVFDPLWLPDGTGLLVTSDIKWPAQQEIDRRNDDFPTDARLWTGRSEERRVGKGGRTRWW